jgi:hypothetical protein
VECVSGVTPFPLLAKQATLTLVSGLPSSRHTSVTLVTSRANPAFISIEDPRGP